MEIQKVDAKLIELWSKTDFDEEEKINIANDIRKRWTGFKAPQVKWLRGICKGEQHL
jgi:hypothetical protein